MAIAGAILSAVGPAAADTHRNRDKVETVTRVPGTVLDEGCGKGLRHVVRHYKGGVQIKVVEGRCVE